MGHFLGKTRKWLISLLWLYLVAKSSLWLGSYFSVAFYMKDIYFCWTWADHSSVVWIKVVTGCAMLWVGHSIRPLLQKEDECGNMKYGIVKISLYEYQGRYLRDDISPSMASGINCREPSFGLPFPSSSYKRLCLSIKFGPTSLWNWGDTRELSSHVESWAYSLHRLLTGFTIDRKESIVDKSSSIVFPIVLDMFLSFEPSFDLEMSTNSNPSYGNTLSQCFLLSARHGCFSLVMATCDMSLVFLPHSPWSCLVLEHKAYSTFSFKKLIRPAIWREAFDWNNNRQKVLV